MPLDSIVVFCAMGSKTSSSFWYLSSQLPSIAFGMLKCHSRGWVESVTYATSPTTSKSLKNSSSTSEGGKHVVTNSPPVLGSYTYTSKGRSNRGPLPATKMCPWVYVTPSPPRWANNSDDGTTYSKVRSS